MEPKSYLKISKVLELKFILQVESFTNVGDLVRTIIVDSTVTARMKKSDAIDNVQI
jgi:hypothetical protein